MCRQVDGTLQIELGVVAKTCHIVGDAIAGAGDGELAAMQRRGSLAGAIGHAHFEMAY
jgi:hypothetical protein